MLVAAHLRSLHTIDVLFSVLPHRSIVYSGPVTEVQAHFESLGFSLPERMDLPSWLQEITTASGELLDQQMWDRSAMSRRLTEV